MGDVDMLGRAVEYLRTNGVAYFGVESVARGVLEAAGVLGSDAQPPPVHQDGEPSMHDLVIAWLRRPFPDVSAGPTEQLIARLEERKAFGLAKYGTLQQVSGPRDPRSDLLDELTDALVYVQQGLERADRARVNVWWWGDRRSTITYELLKVLAGPPITSFTSGGLS